MIASEGEMGAGAEIGRDFLVKVEALFDPYLGEAGSADRCRGVAQGAMQILLAAFDANGPTDGASMMNGLGVALGAFLVQCAPDEQLYAMQSFEAGVNLGAARAASEFSAKGRA